MIEHDAIDHYISKWRRREPEMAQAEVFCPPPQRERLRLFGCLLAEWEDAILTPSDAQVATGKLLWWSEELAAGGKRHPLARARLPLNLLARHAGSEGDAAKEAAFHRDFAAQLQLRQDRKARLPLFRALRRAFGGHRLRLMANGSVEPHREATIPPLRTLWLAWNAARRAKR